MRNYDELIKIVSPKPKMNLKFYKGDDLYSEGDVEDAIIDMIITNEPEDYVDIVYDNYSWSTFYHLTPVRQNILNWYPFDETGDVLEIGCGMGAITNMLCDRCKGVTAVELSKRRATATLFRCREKDNLEIIVGNLNDIEFEKKFDYITLIGVLEYQGGYTDGDNPYKNFLEKIKTLLKPNGKLLIAIENKFGLKYWCGALEDHTSVPFEGINGYNFSNKKVRTFSKNGLDKLVKSSGFKNTYFYYPMPDYKLPTVIYSEKHLPKDQKMENVNYYYIPGNKNLIADEYALSKEVVENDVFEFFANSFLVECSDSDDLGKIIFSCVSGLRQKDYRMITLRTKDNRMIKTPCIKNAADVHMKELMTNEEKLAKSGLRVCKSVREGDKLVYPFLDGENLDTLILDAYEKKDAEAIYSVFEAVWQQILSSSEVISPEENIMYALNIGNIQKKDIYGPVLKDAFIDMIFRNAILTNGEVVWIDQEWALENAPAKFVFYRTILELYEPYEFISELIPFQEVFEKYGLMECYKDFQELNALFFDVVIDRKLCAESNGLPGIDKAVIHNNIVDLL